MATNNLEISRKYSRKAEYRKTYSSSRCRYSKYGCCCYRLENFKDKLIVGTVKHNEHSSKQKHLLCFIFYTQKFSNSLFSLRINFFLCQYHKQQAGERYLFRRVTIIKIINDTFLSILIQFSSSHRRQNWQTNLKNILNLPQSW